MWVQIPAADTRWNVREASCNIKVKEIPKSSQMGHSKKFREKKTIWISQLIEKNLNVKFTKTNYG